MRDVWVQGARYGVTRPPQVDPRGTWTITSDDAGTLQERDAAPGGTAQSHSRHHRDRRAAAPCTSPSARIIAETGRLEATFHGEPLGLRGHRAARRLRARPGVLRLAVAAQRHRRRRTGARAPRRSTGPARGAVAAKVPKIDLPFLRPSMEFGRTAPPAQPATVVVRNATVWTQGPQGRLENADLLVQAGKVVRVGQGLTAPAGAVEIDAHRQARHAGAHRSAHALRRERGERERLRDRPRGADGRRDHAQQHLVLPPARRRAHDHDDQARLRQPDRRRERVREDAVGLAARRVQDRRVRRAR